MRHTRSTTLAYGEVFVLESVVAPAVAGMRTGMSHSDDHGYTIAQVLKNENPALWAGYRLESGGSLKDCLRFVFVFALERSIDPPPGNSATNLGKIAVIEKTVPALVWAQAGCFLRTHSPSRGEQRDYLAPQRSYNIAAFCL
jgi:hypothetical protein